MKYSVLMSVYKNETVAFFNTAVESLLSQTVPPDEIVLVRDGRVYEELQAAIDGYVTRYPALFTYLPLEENGGLGKALGYGLPHCRNEIVGRMDTDDICLPDRFEKQLDFLASHPEVDIVGGNISEFMGNPEEIVDYRTVPQSHEEIVEYLKSRSPMNHVTVAFRKSAVLKAGSYENFYLFEDWYLWVRLYLDGAKFANLDDVLVNVRVLDMAKRRGGMKYYRSCKRLLKFMKDKGVIGFGAYTETKVVRFCGYVLLPDGLRKWAYQKFLRNDSVKSKEAEEKVTEEV